MVTNIGSSSGNIKTMVSFDEAFQAVYQLDRAAEIPLFYKLPDHLTPGGKAYEVEISGGHKILLEPGYHNVPHNKGVLNLTRGTLAAVVGSDYSVLQHGDALGVSMNVIQSLGVKSLYKVENDGNVARMEVLFPDIKVRDDSKQGVQLGVRISNSYDKSTSFRGELYGYRSICSNGMYLRKMLGEIQISARHVGENFVGLEQTVLEFVKKVLDAPQVVESAITDAIHAKLEFADNDQLYDTIFTITQNMKQAEKIIEQIPLKTNRWTAFNAFTRYMSHEDVTHKTRDELAIKSEKVLLDPKFQPLTLKEHAPRQKVNIHA
jgi:hypothetical protein